MKTNLSDVQVGIFLKIDGTTLGYFIPQNKTLKIFKQENPLLFIYTETRKIGNSQLLTEKFEAVSGYVLNYKNGKEVIYPQEPVNASISMDFSEALKLLLEKKAIRRIGWVEDKIKLYIKEKTPETNLELITLDALTKSEDEEDEEELPKKAELEIMMEIRSAVFLVENYKEKAETMGTKIEDNPKFSVSWFPLQEDLLADDWVIVFDNEATNIPIDARVK